MRIPQYQIWNKKLKKIQQVLDIMLDPEFGGVLVWGKAYYDADTGDHDADKDFYKWEDVELRESIGLPDRNGKEIYKGDICLYSYAGEGNPWPWVVIWCSGTHEYLRSPLGWMFADYRHTIKLAAESTLEHPEEYVDAEIIGNIWEHPHLNSLDEQIFWQDVAKRSEENLWWKSLLVQENS